MAGETHAPKAVTPLRTLTEHRAHAVFHTDVEPAHLAVQGVGRRRAQRGTIRALRTPLVKAQGYGEAGLHIDEEEIASTNDAALVEVVEAMPTQALVPLGMDGTVHAPTRART